MTTLVRIAVAALVALFLSSCGFDINIGDFGTGKRGNGKITTDTRKVSESFTEVSASEGLMVYVTQADDFSIEVTADENIIDLIGTDIKNGKLRIHAIENIGQATKEIYVSLPEVTALKSSSGSHLSTENVIKSKSLEIDGSSGALLKAKVTTDRLEIDGSSGANLTVIGDTDRANVDVSSGSNINAKELYTKNCTADASSGGNVKIQVSQSLTADENIIDLIGTDIKNGKLRIHAIENIGQATKEIYVSLPEVTALKSSSGSHLSTENVIKSKSLEIDGSTGALLKAKVATDRLEIDGSSGANLTVLGDTDRANVDVSSGSNINAKELYTKNCTADASSGGNVKIQVSQSLTADASSGGNISYSGEASVKKKKSVSGSVHKY